MGQTFLTQAARIGRFAARILANASAKEKLAKLGDQHMLPKNVGDTLIFRRWLPYGATATSGDSQNRFFQNANGDRTASIVQAHQTVEGFTPTAESISAVDIPVTMQQYSCLFSWTDKTADLYEDDIPAQMKLNIANRMTFVIELKIYGELKAGTNQYFGGSGATTIATTYGPITLDLVRRIVANLDANHAQPITKTLSPGKDYGTVPVRMGYIVLHHSDLSPDIRNMSGFRDAIEYASGSPMPDELGKVEEFRFIKHPDLPPLQNAGAVVATAVNMFSTSGANADVYPFIVLAEDCFGQVALRGMTGVKPTFLPTNQVDKADIFGQRGYAGAMFWKAVVRLNEGWMAVGNVCRTSLA